MRPRVFPAEDRLLLCLLLCLLLRFNEAAGIPRGRREDRIAFLSNDTSLQ